MRLTLRTLLAYLDDTLPAGEARAIGEKVAESEDARKLMDRLKVVIRKRSLATPTSGDPGSPSDPNTVADYLSDTLPANQVAEFEQACLDNEVNLAEVAACHQVLTLLLSEPVRVPPTARKRMYGLVSGPESLPNRKPSTTLPVGGMSPVTVAVEPAGADATLLMGLPPVSEGGSRKWIPVAVGAGLALSAVVAGYFALPKNNPVARVTPATTPSTETVKPNVPETPATRAVNNPDKTPDPNKPATTDPMVTPKPNTEPKPVAIPVPVNDRIVIGKHLNPDAVLLARKAGNEDDRWIRTTGYDASVFTGDTLTALPGYKAKVLLDAEVQVELWANLPEQVACALRDSRIQLHVPVEGISTDFSLLAGRVYVTAKRPTGAKVRVRAAGETLDMTIPDDKTTVVVEVTHTPAKGLTGDRTPAVASVATAVVRGQATVALRGQTLVMVTQGQELLADSTGKLVGPRKVEGNRPAEYFSPVQAFTSDVAPVAQKALANFSKGFTERSKARAAFAVAMANDAKTAEDAYTAHTAVYWEAAVGELPALCDGLTDATRRTFRVAAIDSLRALLAQSPEVEPKLKDVLTTRGRFSEIQAEDALSLLHGVKPTERNEPEVRDKLLGWLASDSLSVRELAFWVLTNDVDPDALKVQALARFDPAGPADVRDAVVKAWKARFAEMK